MVPRLLDSRQKWSSHAINGQTTTSRLIDVACAWLSCATLYLEYLTRSDQEFDQNGGDVFWQLYSLGREERIYEQICKLWEARKRADIRKVKALAQVTLANCYQRISDGISQGHKMLTCFCVSFLSPYCPFLIYPADVSTHIPQVCTTGIGVIIVLPQRWVI